MRDIHYREDTNKKMNFIESFSYFIGTNNNNVIIFGKDRFFRIFERKSKKILKTWFAFKLKQVLELW